MHSAPVILPDPNEVMNTENVAVLRDALLKMGLAGGVLKTMKEAASKTGNLAEEHTTATTTPTTSSRSTEAGERSRSLEDLSHMVPTAIRSRLYNAFSPSSSSLPNVSSIERRPEEKEDSMDHSGQENDQPLPTRLHRSKRSHSTKCMPNTPASHDNINESTPRSISTTATNEQQDSNEMLTPDTITNMMKQPVSSNPYDHPSLSAHTTNKMKPASLFSFHKHSDNLDGTSNTNNNSSMDSGETPSGCVGGKL